MCVDFCAFNKQSNSLQWMITVNGGEERWMNNKVLMCMYQSVRIIRNMGPWLICWYLQLYHAECLWQNYCVERKCGAVFKASGLQTCKIHILKMIVPFSLHRSNYSWVVISFHIFLRPLICMFLKSCLSVAPQKERAVLTWSELMPDAKVVLKASSSLEKYHSRWPEPQSGDIYL